MNSSLQVGVLVILVILGVTLVATVIVGNRVSKPLADAVLALNDIANGEGDLTQRLKVQSKDEITAGQRLQPLRRADPVGGESGRGDQQPPLQRRRQAAPSERALRPADAWS